MEEKAKKNNTDYKKRKLNKIHFLQFFSTVIGTGIAIGLIPMLLGKISSAITSLSSTISSNNENSDGNNNEIYIYQDNPDEKVYVYTDPDTGVQYLIFRGYRKAGMTPRLDKNGNVMVQETEQETSETSTEISEISSE